MLGVLFLLLLLVPLAELYVIIQVAHGIGALNTIAVLIVVSLVGAWLVKREGLGLMARIQRELGEGRAPTASVADGFLVLLAGALLLTPGFLTDIAGILLLLPPVRAAVRAGLMRRFRARATQALSGGGTGRGGRFGTTRWVVYDTRSTERGSSPEPPPARGEISSP